jgi:5-methyltetrahydropteroyltriglutamate--homocysteine methyltransferase
MPKAQERCDNGVGMTTTTATTYRADHVGSLLRPPEVLQAHADHAAQRISQDERRAIEDRAILTALDLQKQVGLDIFSDGEYRRGNWAGDFVAAVEGYVQGEPPIRFQWQLVEGAPPEEADTVRASLRTMPQQSGMVIGQRLRQRQRLTEHEVGFLKEHAAGPIKMTMPAPSYVVTRGYKPGVTDQVYADRSEVLRDVAGIVRREVAALVDDGVAYIQLDNPHYPDYISEERRQQWQALGVDSERALNEDIEADNSALRGADRARVRLAMHLCRGNGPLGRWHTAGGYERIAEQVFGRVDVDRFLLEYDSERAGGFEPLRFVPGGKTVVLGLVTTKSPELESQDVLLRRIEEASKYIPMDNLALSPQCGFASTLIGNPLSWDDQRRKLELVVDTARKAWGR